MPDLHNPSTDAERLVELRSRAASRLKGPGAARGSAASAADALGVLHALASSPETASDALTLLHELQVYQVEVELQAQELRESRGALEAALRRQIELYDHQPVGSFTIDLRTAVHELNLGGAGMLGIARDDVLGLHLDAFFCADSARRLRQAVTACGTRPNPTVCVLRLRPSQGPERPVLASIGRDAAANFCQVSLMATEDVQPADRVGP